MSQQQLRKTHFDNFTTSPSPRPPVSAAKPKPKPPPASPGSVAPTEFIKQLDDEFSLGQPEQEPTEPAATQERQQHHTQKSSFRQGDTPRTQPHVGARSPRNTAHLELTRLAPAASVPIQQSPRSPKSPRKLTKQANAGVAIGRGRTVLPPAVPFATAEQPAAGTTLVRTGSFLKKHMARFGLFEPAPPAPVLARAPSFEKMARAGSFYDAQTGAPIIVEEDREHVKLSLAENAPPLERLAVKLATLELPSLARLSNKMGDGWLLKQNNEAEQMLEVNDKMNELVARLADKIDDIHGQGIFEVDQTKELLLETSPEEKERLLSGAVECQLAWKRAGFSVQSQQSEAFKAALKLQAMERSESPESEEETVEEWLDEIEKYQEALPEFEAWQRMQDQDLLEKRKILHKSRKVNECIDDMMRKSKEDYAALEEENKKIQEQLASTKFDAEEAARKLRLMEAKAKARDAEKDKKQELPPELQVELRALRSQVQAAEGRAEQLKVDNSKLRQALSVNPLEEKVNELKRDVAFYETRLGESKEEAKELRDQVGVLETTLAELREETAGASVADEREKYRLKLESLSAQAEANREMKRELQLEAKELNATVGDLEVKLHRVETEKESLEVDLNQKSSELKVSREETTALKRQLEMISQASGVEELQKVLQEEQAETIRWKAANTKLNERNNEMQVQVNELRSEIAQGDQLYEELRQARQAEAKAAKREAVALRNEIRLLKTRAQKACEERDDLSDKHRVLTRRLSAKGITLDEECNGPSGGIATGLQATVSDVEDLTAPSLKEQVSTPAQEDVSAVPLEFSQSLDVFQDDLLGCPQDNLCLQLEESASESETEVKDEVEVKEPASETETLVEKPLNEVPEVSEESEVTQDTADLLFSAALGLHQPAESPSSAKPREEKSESEHQERRNQASDHEVGDTLVVGHGVETAKSEARLVVQEHKPASESKQAAILEEARERQQAWESKEIAMREEARERQQVWESKQTAMLEEARERQQAWESKEMAMLEETSKRQQVWESKEMAMLEEISLLKKSVENLAIHDETMSKTIRVREAEKLWFENKLILLLSPEEHEQIMKEKAERDQDLRHELDRLHQEEHDAREKAVNTKLLAMKSEADAREDKLRSQLRQVLLQEQKRAKKIQDDLEAQLLKATAREQDMFHEHTAATTKLEKIIVTLKETLQAEKETSQQRVADEVAKAHAQNKAVQGRLDQMMNESNQQKETQKEIDQAADDWETVQTATRAEIAHLQEAVQVKDALITELQNSMSRILVEAKTKSEVEVNNMQRNTKNIVSSMQQLLQDVALQNTQARRSLEEVKTKNTTLEETNQDLSHHVQQLESDLSSAKLQLELHFKEMEKQLSYSEARRLSENIIQRAHYSTAETHYKNRKLLPTAQIIMEASNLVGVVDSEEQTQVPEVQNQTNESMEQNMVSPESLHAARIKRTNELRERQASLHACEEETSFGPIHGMGFRPNLGQIQDRDSK